MFSSFSLSHSVIYRPLGGFGFALGIGQSHGGRGGRIKCIYIVLVIFH